MKIEVLIRLEGDYDVESGQVPDLIYVRREESVALPPGASDALAPALAAISTLVEETIDGSVQTARQRLATIADHAAVDA